MESVVEALAATSALLYRLGVRRGERLFIPSEKEK
jgi:hypothetical protein